MVILDRMLSWLLRAIKEATAEDPKDKADRQRLEFDRQWFKQLSSMPKSNWQMIRTDNGFSFDLCVGDLIVSIEQLPVTVFRAHGRLAPWDHPSAPVLHVGKEILVGDCRAWEAAVTDVEGLHLDDIHSLNREYVNKLYNFLLRLFQKEIKSILEDERRDSYARQEISLNTEHARHEVILDQLPRG